MIIILIIVIHRPPGHQVCENLVIYIVCIWGPGLECLSSRATLQAHFKHPSSTRQAHFKHPPSTRQAHFKHPSSTPHAFYPPFRCRQFFDHFLGFLFSTMILTPFLSVFCLIFDQFSDPLEPQKYAWRLYESSFFTFSTMFF